MFKYTFQVESVSINLHYFKNFVNFAKSFFSANFVKLGKFEKKNMWMANLKLLTAIKMINL